jgi:hypothetical protein
VRSIIRNCVLCAGPVGEEFTQAGFRHCAECAASEEAHFHLFVVFQTEGWAVPDSRALNELYLAGTVERAVEVMRSLMKMDDGVVYHRVLALQQANALQCLREVAPTEVASRASKALGYTGQWITTRGTDA